MDAKRFTKQSPGRLVEISVPRKDWAFVPNPLPPPWAFPADLWPALAEAKQELARLDGIARSLPNPELLLRPLQNREAITSSSLEGTYATPEELLMFELQPREPTSESDPVNAHREVANHSRSLRRGMALLQEQPFCLRLIREIHEVLLSGVRGRDKAPGEFRRVHVHIGSDFRYNPPPPNHLIECLDAFEKALHTEDRSIDPMVQCFLMHYQFEAIHPFLDGNGRVGRVLLSLMIQARCNLHMPWLYLSAYFERYRDEYIDGLFKISTDGDWTSWVRLCIRATTAQAKDSIQRCDALKRLQEKFHTHINDAGTTKAGVRAHQIVEELFSAPMLSIPDNARRWGISYPTAKSDVNKLVSLGVLRELKGHHPALYVCGPILKIAFSDSKTD